MLGTMSHSYVQSLHCILDTSPVLGVITAAAAATTVPRSKLLNCGDACRLREKRGWLQFHRQLQVFIA